MGSIVLVINNFQMISFLNSSTKSLTHLVLVLYKASSWKAIERSEARRHIVWNVIFTKCQNAKCRESNCPNTTNREEGFSFKTKKNCVHNLAPLKLLTQLVRYSINLVLKKKSPEIRSWILISIYLPRNKNLTENYYASVSFSSVTNAS